MTGVDSSLCKNCVFVALVRASERRGTSKLFRLFPVVDINMDTIFFSLGRRICGMELSSDLLIILYPIAAVSNAFETETKLRRGRLRYWYCRIVQAKSLI